jgi:hypothetical protein
MEPVRDYELKAFFSYVIEVLERLKIPYMVVGGFAAIFHGHPRLTIDVDIVVDIRTEHIKPFVAAFPIPEYYVSEDGIRDAVKRRYPFNAIQPATGAKIDLVPLPDDPFSKAAFHRRQRMAFDQAGTETWFITAEDIVLAKLIAFENTQSDKHLNDVRGVLVTQWETLDMALIRHEAAAVGVLMQFERVLETVRRDIDL